MTTTTLTAIRKAIEKTIINIAPPASVEKLAAPRFELRSDSFSWDTAAASDIDRRFDLEISEVAHPKSFGVIAEREHHARLTMVIGHIIGRNLRDARDRIDEDRRVLIRELVDRKNYPDAVWRIAFETGSVRLAKEDRVVTELSFAVTYSAE